MESGGSPASRRPCERLDPAGPRLPSRPDAGALPASPPPLPRQFGTSGGIWLALAVGLAVIVTLVVVYQALGTGFDRWNSAFLRRFVSIRTGLLNPIARHMDTILSSRWTIRFLRLGAIVALVVYRRWRHLFTFLGSIVAVEITAHQLSLLVASPRPIGVKIIGSWEGFSFPSPPLAALAVSLVGVTYTLLPQGPIRSSGKWAVGAVLNRVPGEDVPGRRPPNRRSGRDHPRRRHPGSGVPLLHAERRSSPSPTDEERPHTSTWGSARGSHPTGRW